jgi:hypothetical protein
LFHHSRDKIRKILAMPKPKPFARLNPLASIVDPFKLRTDAILAADERGVKLKEVGRPCGRLVNWR